MRSTQTLSAAISAEPGMVNTQAQTTWPATAQRTDRIFVEFAFGFSFPRPRKRHSLNTLPCINRTLKLHIITLQLFTCAVVTLGTFRRLFP